MKNELNKVIMKLKSTWDSMDFRALNEIQILMGDLAKSGFDKNQDDTSKAIELYKDSEFGFIFTMYSEINGVYRIPHNHGNGWVVYCVLEGSVEMGDYINWVKTNDESKLIKKETHILNAGDVKMYYPGDIHDTKCISINATILRLTSCDLKIEETEGRMKRFNSLKDF